MTTNYQGPKEVVVITVQVQSKIEHKGHVYKIEFAMCTSVPVTENKHIIYDGIMLVCVSSSILHALKRLLRLLFSIPVNYRIII